MVTEEKPGVSVFFRAVCGGSWGPTAAMKIRSCRTPRYSPGVHMIKLTHPREITLYKWAHPDDDERP
jgi:hypothetical protein